MGTREPSDPDAIRWRQVDELVSRALPLSRDERAQLLDRECAEDSALREEVESLLAGESRAGAFLDPAASPLRGLTPDPGRRAVEEDPSQDPWIGRRLGGFVLRQVIGSGGMGRVYEAWQERPGRGAAVKILRRGLRQPSDTRRFEHEASILGRLRHPCIAHLYEVGQVADPLGQGEEVPYLAMELIAGARPITRYALEESSSLRERVELFLQVCDGVHHAHQRGVLHRDLKPSNLLVDSEGRPRIIDFGIARSVGPEFDTGETRTRVGELIGTLQYMSPQQCSGSSRDVDLRSDVYSLGLVLYELVTGERPYDLSDTTIYEALRIIREEPPRPPSRFEPACRGDLETVLLHALEKDADHRYAAVSELAQDLRRWIAREPIAARPPSTAHRLRLFASRNPLAASALVAAVLALVAGAGVATAFGLREARAHAESDRQARIAVEVNDFLNEDVLGAVDPYQSANPDLRVREALDRAADKIGGRTFSEPLVEAGIRASIGRGYLSLGLPTPALAHLDPAGTIIRRERGDDHLESLHARQNVARARLLAGDVAAAEAEARALRADYERLGEAVAGNGTDLARLLGLQAEIARRRGDARSALGLYEAAHLRHVAALGVDHILSIAFECSLAECLREIGRLEDSESMQRDALERSRRTLGDDHPRTVVSLANLALVRQDRGALEEARTLLEEAVSTGVRVQGARHEATLTDRRNLALVLKQLGRNDEAANEIELAIDGFRESLGERHALTLGALLVHGQVAMQTGRFEEAEQTLLEVTEMGREVLGNGHPLVLEAALNLARLLAHTDRRGNAIDLLREELDAADDPAADAPPGERVLALRNEYGKLLLDAGRPEEAEPILARVVRDLRATLGTHMGTAVSLRMHAKSLEALKRTEEARQSYEGSRAILVELLGADHTFVRRIDQDLSVLGKSKDAGTGR